MNKIKELNQKELSCISGGGTISTACNALGLTLGAAIGFVLIPMMLSGFAAVAGITSIVLTGSKLGRGIGKVIEKASNNKE